jgi:hypothetical protein
MTAKLSGSTDWLSLREVLALVGWDTVKTIQTLQTLKERRTIEERQAPGGKQFRWIS